MLGDARVGFFAGMATGALETQVLSGASTDSSTYFAGAYGRLDAGTFHTDFAVTGGVSSSDAERVVANNLVLGGLETARADFTSYFIAPEVTVGTEMTLGGLAVKPSANLRYNLVHSGNYRETGLTAGALAVNGRTSHIFDARIQMAVPIAVGTPDTTFEFRGGLDGRFVAGGNSFDATLAGQTIAGFDPGGPQSSIGGFVGAEFSHALSGASSLFAATEIGAGTGTGFRASASFGIKIGF